MFNPKACVSVSISRLWRRALPSCEGIRSWFLPFPRYDRIRLDSLDSKFQKQFQKKAATLFTGNKQITKDNPCWKRFDIGPNSCFRGKFPGPLTYQLSTEEVGFCQNADHVCCKVLLLKKNEILQITFSPLWKLHSLCYSVYHMAAF